MRAATVECTHTYNNELYTVVVYGFLDVWWSVFLCAVMLKKRRSRDDLRMIDNGVRAELDYIPSVLPFSTLQATTIRLLYVCIHSHTPYSYLLICTYYIDTKRKSMTRDWHDVLDSRSIKRKLITLLYILLLLLLYKQQSGSNESHCYHIVIYT